MPQDILRGVTYDMRGSASQNPTRGLGARPGEVRTFAVKALVTDEVLHPIGKIQPLLIGWNLPDEVESMLVGEWIGFGGGYLGAARCCCDRFACGIGGCVDGGGA